MSSIKEPPGDDETPASDAGGVAARQGFKYQDHVAAFFVLAMLDDERLLKVECETADDILLIWKGFSSEIPEYVQVKTTEDDKKWSQTEIIDRGGKSAKNPTSLAEKSLLCDCHAGGALFRIVSRRDVNRTLACLKLTRDSRARFAPAAALGGKLARKWPTKSKNDNDLAYWAQTTVWQVTGDIELLEAKNQQYLARLAERSGANPTHSHADRIYADLLKMVDKAATASRVSTPEAKVITRERAKAWWLEHLKETEAAQKRTSKPYRIQGDSFFAELHQFSEADIRRALTAYDARYEKEKWRSLQLADHLVEWLPEIALKASDLVSVSPTNLRRKTKDAVQAIQRRRDLTPEQVLAETLLHAVVRQSLGSEPIACKLFYESGGDLRSFGSAHIVHAETGDELWLGRATVATAATYDDVVAKVLSDLENILDADFLKQERETILTLREPQHLLPTTLEAAFSRNAPIDDLIDAICVPVLIGYDSAVLGSGYNDNYRAQLIEEVKKAYDTLKPALPADLKPVKVHIFLIPIECVRTLSGQFADLMKVS